MRAEEPACWRTVASLLSVGSDKHLKQAWQTLCWLNALLSVVCESFWHQMWFLPTPEMKSSHRWPEYKFLSVALYSLKVIALGGLIWAQCYREKTNVIMSLHFHGNAELILFFVFCFPMITKCSSNWDEPTCLMCTVCSAVHGRVSHAGGILMW